MLKILSGLAFGYFLYTKEGREQLSSLGTYVSNTVKASFKELNSPINKKENINGRNSTNDTEQHNGQLEIREVLHKQSSTL